MKPVFCVRLCVIMRCGLLQVKGGVAESDGRLLQGDQIITVNGEDMKTATQEEAAAILKVWIQVKVWIMSFAFQIITVLNISIRYLNMVICNWILQTLMGKITMTVGRLKAGSRSSSRRSSSQSGQSGLKKSDSNVSSKGKGKHSKSK